MENHLKLRSGGLTSAVGNFPMGLVLIEKEKQNQRSGMGFRNTSIMSDDILQYAKREAARIRKFENNPSPTRAPYPAARYSNNELDISINEPRRSRPQTAVRAVKSVSLSRPRSSVCNFAQPKSASEIVQKKSSISLRSEVTAASKISDQLCHIRNEIEGMSERLAEEVPSELEDVDTDFDDESNRWFARELYAVKHECTLLTKMRDVNRQRVAIVKLHRTALRMVQVAASRPILRVLNPHIFAQLGDLVRDLVHISDQLELPLWDPQPILDALESAVYFPPRRSISRKCSIAPSDIKETIAPANRKSVSRKPSQRNFTKKIRSKSVNKDQSPYSQSKSNMRLSGPRTSLPSKKLKSSTTKLNTKNSKSILKKRNSSTVRRTDSTENQVQNRSDAASGTVVGRLIDIDSMQEPITIENHDRRWPISTHIEKEATDETVEKSANAGNRENSENKDFRKFKAEISAYEKLVPTIKLTQHQSHETNEGLLTPKSKQSLDYISSQLDRIEQEENDVRERLIKFTQIDYDRKAAIRHKNETNPIVPSELFEVRLLEDSISHIKIKSEKANRKLKESTLLTNKIAEDIMNDILKEILAETEASLVTYVQNLYDGELDGVSDLNPISYINTINSSLSSSSIFDDAARSIS